MTAVSHLHATTLPPEYDTPDEKLLYAVVHGELELAKSAIAAGANVEAKINDDYTPLQVSVMLGHSDVAEYLIDHGVEIVKTHWYTPSALVLAARYNRIELIDRLIDEVTKLSDIGAKECERAVENAVIEGHLEVVELFVESGFRVDLGLYCEDSRPPRKVSISRDPVPVLVIAAKFGHLDLVKYLVKDCGLDANHNCGASRYYSENALYTAVEFGNLEIAKFLIANGADVDATKYGEGAGRTSLSVALAKGNFDCIELLLANGASLNAENSNFRAIRTADAYGRDHYVERFEKMGSSLGQKTDNPKKTRVVEQSLSAGPSDEELGSFASRLIEGDWPVQVNVKKEGGDQDIRVAILGDQEDREFTDYLLAEMSAFDRVAFVERDSLDRIIYEHRLNRSELVHYNRLAELSHLIAADRMILVRTIELKKQKLRRVQLLDVKRGVVMAVHYAPVKKDDWATFSNRYTNIIGPLLSSRVQANRIPISLLGAQTEWGTLEGERMEKTLFHALEYELAQHPDYLLLDRESLSQLTKENSISGNSESTFDMSGLFISAGINVDMDTGAVKSIVLQASPVAGFTENAITVEKPTDAKSLHLTAIELLNELHIKLAGSGDANDSYVPDFASIENDRMAILEQAHWLYQYGFYADAMSKIETAAALGVDDAETWKSYLVILDKYIQENYRSWLEDGDYLKLINEEHSRLYALGKYYFATQNVDLNTRTKFFPRLRHPPALNSFSDSLKRFQSTTIRRRYENELRELEQRFLVALGLQSALKIKNASELSNSISISALPSLPYLRFQSEEDLENLFKQTVFGKHYSSLSGRHAFASGILQANTHTWLRWVREYAKPRVSFVIHQECISLSHGAIRRRITEDLINYVDKHPTVELNAYLAHHLTLENYNWNGQYEVRPEYRIYEIEGRNSKAITRKGQAHYTALCKLFILLPADVPNWYTFRNYLLSNSPWKHVEHFTELDLLYEIHEAGVRYAEIIQSEGASIKYNKWSDASLKRAYDRIQILSNQPRQGFEVSEVDAYWIDLAGYPSDDLDRFSFIYEGYSGSSNNEAYAIHANYSSGAIWLLGRYRGVNDKIWLFKIDESNLEVTHHAFDIPEGVWIPSGARSLIVVTPKKIFISGKNQLSPTNSIVIDVESGAVNQILDFGVRNPSSPVEDPKFDCGFYHKGSIYYTGYPKFLDEWDIENNRRTIGHQQDFIHHARQSMVFVKLDLDTLRHTVISNSRRNPPETPLDKPLGSSYYNFFYNEERGLFSFTHSGEHFAYDPDFDTFSQLSKSERDELLKGAKIRPSKWTSGHSKGTWSISYGSRFLDADLGKLIPLRLKSGKVGKTLGLNLKSLDEHNQDREEAVRTEIRQRQIAIVGNEGKYSTIVFRRSGQVLLIENEQLKKALIQANQSSD